jgi:hypothetical protein
MCSEEFVQLIPPLLLGSEMRAELDGSRCHLPRRINAIGGMLSPTQ